MSRVYYTTSDYVRYEIPLAIKNAIIKKNLQLEAENELKLFEDKKFNEKKFEEKKILEAKFFADREYYKNLDDIIFNIIESRLLKEKEEAVDERNAELRQEAQKQANINIESAQPQAKDSSAEESKTKINDAIKLIDTLIGKINKEHEEAYAQCKTEVANWGTKEWYVEIRKITHQAPDMSAIPLAAFENAIKSSNLSEEEKAKTIDAMSKALQTDEAKAKYATMLNNIKEHLNATRPPLYDTICKTPELKKQYDEQYAQLIESGMDPFESAKLSMKVVMQRLEKTNADFVTAEHMRQFITDIGKLAGVELSSKLVIDLATDVTVDGMGEFLDKVFDKECELATAKPVRDMIELNYSHNKQLEILQNAQKSLKAGNLTDDQVESLTKTVQAIDSKLSQRQEERQQATAARTPGLAPPGS